MTNKLNVMNYEEALDILADKINFGADIPDKEQREKMLIGFIDYVAKQ